MENPLSRLSNYRTGPEDPYYLVYKNLFADLEKASKHAQGALLDIGCGNKPYERMFEGKIASYTGCDVEQSSERKVDIICPATAIAAPDGSYDTVISTQVIEHVADHQSLLREAHRILRSPGVLILSGPMYWPLHEEPYDFFRFTTYGLEYLLKEAGFAEIEIVPNGGKWALCGQVLIHCVTGTFLYRRRVIMMINRLFSHLDDRHRDFRNTMNYVVVARKL
jgi:SAM-dependent methyltransferase